MPVSTIRSAGCDADLSCIASENVVPSGCRPPSAMTMQTIQSDRPSPHRALAYCMRPGSATVSGRAVCMDATDEQSIDTTAGQI